MSGNGDTNNNVPFNPMTFDPRLWEGLPSQTNRYDDTNAGSRKKRLIPPGPFIATQEVDAAPAGINVARGNEIERARYPDTRILEVKGGWKEYHHPVEGRAFFYNEKLQIVTEMYIRHENVLGEVMNWYNVFVTLRDHVLPEAAAFDVFLDCSSEGTCRYYLIDHANKTICWLRQRTTSDLGISDVRNVLHLRALLNEEYWTHAEYMPKDENHLGSSRAELQAALASSMLDHMTSEGSTSPFTTEECEAYLLALDKASSSGFMIYLNWSIARVMGLLVHSRNVNLYGQYGARLDRTATVEGRRHPFRSSLYLYRSRMLGGGPEIHLNRLENLWVDRIIYTHHWRALLRDLFEEWTSAAVAAGVMWASNMVFVASSGVDIVPKVICGVSGILAGGSGVFGLYLLREHRALGRYAAHAANYFQLHEKHNTGLQDLSVKYSLPWAGVMWSFAITCFAVVIFLFSSLVALAGAHAHIAFTLFLVIGVYVHARGVEPTIGDLRRVFLRYGFPRLAPHAPVARG
ncbi:WW domain protein [Ceratobasidium sp. AG-Ba]|nr:WW domain protein [Ceratobasidium sp. AG-Ba]